jgi:hypothetical protein
VKSKRAPEFHELYNALPRGIQKRADKAYKLFTENPNHPGLNFEQLKHDPIWYSARISIHYRAICTREGDTYVWFWVGTHTEYEKLIKHG